MLTLGGHYGKVKGGYFGNGGHYGPKRADIMVWADTLVGADTMVHDRRHNDVVLSHMIKILPSLRHLYGWCLFQVEKFWF